MNTLELHGRLWTFLQKWCDEDTFRLRAISAGVSEHTFIDFPLGIFSEYARAREGGIGLKGSLQRVRTKYPALSDEVTVYDLNHDALIDEVKAYASRIRYEVLAKSIAENPDLGPQILSKFHENKSFDHTPLDFEEFIKVSQQEQLEAIASNETLIEIPEWEMLSKAIGGFNHSRISILMALTGFGKTMFGLRFAYSAGSKFSVLYCNMEMSLKDVGLRLSSSVLHRPMKETIKTNPFPELLANGPRDFSITSGRSMSLEEIMAVARLRKKKGLNLMIVDYDQKLSLNVTRDSPEWKALQNAMVELEELSKELRCHIMILSQLNREGEISGSFRSQFPASTVLELGQDEESGIVYLRAIKNRFGRVNAGIKLNYIPEKQIIEEIGEYVWTKKQKRKT